MKKRVNLLLMFLLFISGCSANTSQSQNQGNETVQPSQIKTIPKYKYPDEFFNQNFTKDDKGNCYFSAGHYFYKTDQNNKVTKIFHRVINNKYYVSNAKYANGKIYLLVVKVNHKIENGSLGIATIDLQGTNFQYLNDLEYAERYLPAHIIDFRIANDNLYILYPENTIPCIYTYSLDSNTIIDYQETTIDEERFEFYKKYFPNYPYEQINHVKNNNFYSILYSENKPKTFVRYNSIDKSTDQYDLTEYDNSKNTRILLRLELINENWFLISSEGVFKFDLDFQNKQQLLDKSIFNKSYTMTPKNQMIVLELVDNN